MLDTLTAILARHEGVQGALLPVLHEVQQAFGHVPPELVPRIAEALTLSRAEVHGEISFFHELRSAPVGKRHLQICRAEACQAVGARELEQAAVAALGIAMGETRADGEWSLDAVYCLGNCACGPSVRLGDEIVGRVDGARLRALIGGGA